MIIFIDMVMIPITPSQFLCHDIDRSAPYIVLKVSLRKWCGEVDQTWELIRKVRKRA
jgi:hypothetical protein